MTNCNMMDCWDCMELDARDQARADALDRERCGVISVGDAVENFVTKAAKLSKWEPWQGFPESDVQEIESAIRDLRAARAWEVAQTIPWQED